MRALAHRFTRRQMIATSAAVSAPLVLAACGKAADPDDDRSEDADPDLLNAILAQHLAVLDAAEAAGDGPLPDVTQELATQRKDSTAKLESFISERDGDATTDAAEAAKAESPTEALILQLEDSIEVSLNSIGELSSPAYRQAVHRFVTEDAAALAALRSETGEEVAPDSFVFGAPVSKGDDQ
ncbi:MAG: hypothetical protein QOI31_726 [Solirubrobacterales bacterium]|jgi:hypothetical protein|nr:hypothetical protein [Solirubrobacterales bacterium]